MKVLQYACSCCGSGESCGDGGGNGGTRKENPFKCLVARNNTTSLVFHRLWVQRLFAVPGRLGGAQNGETERTD